MENAEKLEKSVTELQKENDRLEKQLRLTVSTQRLRTDDAIFKENERQIQQLSTEVEELKTRLRREKAVKERAIHAALEKKCSPKELFRNCTGEEILHLVESQLLASDSKIRSLTHSLQLTNHTLNEKRKTLKDIEKECMNCDIPTETGCLQNIRYLETQHKKVGKNIKENESIKQKLQSMVEHLREKQLSVNRLIAELDRRKSEILENLDEKTKNEGFLQHNEKELLQMKEIFQKLKEATCCYDITEIESRFLKQSSISSDLREMKKSAEKKLMELKAEKKDVCSKMSAFKDSDSFYPRSEESISFKKSRLNEQESRRDNAKKELSTIENVFDRAKKICKRLILKMNPESDIKELEAFSFSQLVSYIEKLLLHKLPIVE